MLLPPPNFLHPPATLQHVDNAIQYGEDLEPKEPRDEFDDLDERNERIREYDSQNGGGGPSEAVGSRNFE